MTGQRKGGARTIRGKHFARVRIGKGRRITVALSGVSTAAAAEKRAAEIADVASVLVRSGRWYDVKDIAKAMGAAKTERQLRILRLAAERMAAVSPGIGEVDETFEHFAGRWTSGALHREFPDHVPDKDHTGDIGILSLYVNPILGPLPVPSVRLEHCDAVMRSLPETCGKARRRHVAQVIHRVLALAAYPARLIPASPLPKGWLPKLGPQKALPYLYPDEDSKLLGAADDVVELAYRVLYGFLSREGLRVSEALALAWPDLDLKRGVLTLDENKTDDPRAWAMQPDVVRGLTTWKKIVGGEGPFTMIAARHLAERFRDDLRAAGVTRSELFRSSPTRRRIRIHDLRATFVTISLANGKTESWVQDRTGHRSTLMIARYRRAARTVAELNLGALAPMDEAIPELRSGGAQVGHGADGSSAAARSENAKVIKLGSPSRTRTGTTVRSRDFKAPPPVASEPPSRDFKAGNDDAKHRSTCAPHPAPHPLVHAAAGLARELVTWDTFELLFAEEAGIRLPKRRPR